MSDDQDRCEWVSVSSGTGLPGLSRTNGRQTVVCVYVCVCVCISLEHHTNRCVRLATYDFLLAFYSDVTSR